MLSFSLSQIWGSNASEASPTDLSLWLIPQCLWSQVENTCLIPHCSLWLGVLFYLTGIKLQGYRTHLKLMGKHQERSGAWNFWEEEGRNGQSGPCSEAMWKGSSSGSVLVVSWGREATFPTSFSIPHWKTRRIICLFPGYLALFSGDLIWCMITHLHTYAKYNFDDEFLAWQRSIWKICARNGEIQRWKSVW